MNRISWRYGYDASEALRHSGALELPSGLAEFGGKFHALDGATRAAPEIQVDERRVDLAAASATPSPVEDRGRKRRRAESDGRRSYAPAACGACAPRALLPLPQALVSAATA